MIFFRGQELDHAAQIRFGRLFGELTYAHPHDGVIDRAGELPREVRAADGFDLRFDEVVTSAVPAAGASFGPEGAQR